MAHIREIIEGETAQAVNALLVLRPRWKTPDAVVDFVDTKLRPTGYRLVGAFEHSFGAAVSIVGLRELWSTALGHYMYIDDLSTLARARGNGFANELLRWVIADARRAMRRNPSGFRRWRRSGGGTSAVHAEPFEDLGPSLLARSRQLTKYEYDHADVRCMQPARRTFARDAIVLSPCGLAVPYRNHGELPSPG